MEKTEKKEDIKFETNNNKEKNDLDLNINDNNINFNQKNIEEINDNNQENKEEEKSSNNTKKITNMNMPSVYTAEKGGMKGIDHQKIDKIIYETTKNSRIFKKNEEDLVYIS